MDEKLHDAFISYSRKDRVFASLLENALEAFSPPKIGTIPQKHLDIFRDEEDFTGTDYHKAVSKHLQDSRKLIVICTPAARASQYVNDEIHFFAETNGSEHIIPILLDGLPNNEANEQQEANKAFPDALVNCMQMPLAIDYRDFRLGSDKVSKKKFASVWFSLLANLYDIGRNVIEQRERKRQARIRNLWIGGLGSVIVTLSVFLGLAVFNWFKAERAKEAEQQATKTAIEQRDKAKRAAAETEFREAQRHYENGNLPRTLAHLAYAIRFDPSLLSARTLLINLLRQKYSNLLPFILSHQDTVNFAEFNFDGTTAVTASRDKTARLWDVESGQALGEPMKHEDEVFQATFSPDGMCVITASKDKTARLWDAKTGRALGEPMKHEDEVLLAIFSPDSTTVATDSGDKAVRLWDAKTGQAIGEPMRHESMVYDVVFSLDGMRVVTRSKDKTARLWDAKTGRALGTPMKHKDRVYQAIFSPDGTRVVSASKDKTARLWDARTGLALGEPMKHKDEVYRATFSSDGTRVITASKDKTARLWDVKTGRALGEPMKHEDEVFQAIFSPDGTRVVTRSKDKTARL